MDRARTVRNLHDHEHCQKSWEALEGGKDINLDELIADARRRKGVKAPKRSAKRATPTDDFRQTKEELRAMRLAACVPQSVHLRTTTQYCDCGEVYHSMNNVPLVKRIGSNLEHYEPHEDLADFIELPRFVENRIVKIPYCDSCLTNATIVVEVVPDVLEKSHES